MRERPAAATSEDETTVDAFDRRLKRGLILAAEIALVVAIIGLLLATWLPALIGAHPWTAK